MYRIDVDLRTGGPAAARVRLTQDSPTNQSPFTSPDGQRIAYTRRNGDDTGFAVMEANGTSERLIRKVSPDMLARMALLGWRSDEELLISDAGLGTGGLLDAPKTLKTLNVRTGDISPLPGDPILSTGLSFVPSVNELFFVNRINDALTSRPLLGDTTRVTAVHKDWLDYAVSPDGRSVVYSTADWGADGNKIPVTGDFRIRQVAGDDERIVVSYPDTKDGVHAPFAFSPDSRHLLYRDPNLELRVLSIETGQSSRLLTEKPANVDFEWVDGHWSRDGKYVVIEGHTLRTSWRALDGVTYDAVVKLMATRK